MRDGSQDALEKKERDWSPKRAATDQVQGVGSRRRKITNKLNKATTPEVAVRKRKENVENGRVRVRMEVLCRA
jgi:hypothetical protein